MDINFVKLQVRGDGLANVNIEFNSIRYVPFEVVRKYFLRCDLFPVKEKPKGFINSRNGILISLACVIYHQLVRIKRMEIGFNLMRLFRHILLQMGKKGVDI